MNLSLTKRDGIINILDFVLNHPNFLNACQTKTEKQKRHENLYFKVQDRYFDSFELDKPADCFKDFLKRKFFSENPGFEIFNLFYVLRISLFSSVWYILNESIKRRDWNRFYQEFLYGTGGGQIQREKQFAVLKKSFAGRKF